MGRPRTKQRCIKKDKFNELPICAYRTGIYCSNDECKGKTECPLPMKRRVE